MSFSAGGVGGRVLVYDFYPHGHCPGWMGLVATSLLEYGCEVVMACCMDSDSVELVAEKIRAKDGEVIPIPENVKVHAEYAVQLASTMGIQNIFFPNFDTVFNDLGKKGVLVDFSGFNVAGIWLRPTLQGELLVGFRKFINKLTRTAQGKTARRKATTLKRNMDGIAMLAEGASAANDLFLFLLKGESSKCLSKYLPVHNQSYICDPWLEKSEINRYDAREQLGLDQDRKVFLHAGTLRPEKGLADACLAFSLLPSTLKESACLLRAGTVGAEDAPFLNKLMDDGLAFVIDRYLTDDELLLCFAACDGVLMPYRDQKESSGILIHAAAHGRPVIASDYGLIGEWTKKYNLGLTFCHKNIAELAQSIEKFFYVKDWCNDGMLEFSQLNSPQLFKETIVTNWAAPVVSQRLVRE